MPKIQWLSTKIILVVCIACTAHVIAQGPAPISTPPVLLQETSSTPTDVPPFRATNATLCDQDNSTYSLVTTRGTPHDVVISISRDGHFKNVYTVASTIDREPGTVAFAVAPEGTIYLIDQLPDKGTYLQRYDSHGKPAPPARIALPSDRLNISQLAVNNDGMFIISGIYGEDEPEPRKRAPFIGVFDADGQHFREVTDIDRKQLVNDIGNSHTEQALTSGDDKSFYLEVRRHLFVINEGGHVVRDMKLGDRPEDSFSNLIKISGNRILVACFVLDAKQTRRLHLRLELYDLTTGALIATYDPSAISDTLACFDYQNGFTFLKVRQGALFFVDAALP